MVYEKKNRSLVFSGSRKIRTLGSTVQWETRQASFPTGTVGPRVGIFLSPLNTNDGFYLSHIPHTNQWERWVAQLRIIVKGIEKHSSSHSPAMNFDRSAVSLRLNDWL